MSDTPLPDADDEASITPPPFVRIQRSINDYRTSHGSAVAPGL